MGAKEKIKERTFEVPKEFIGTFFNQMDESELDYSLGGLDYENDILFVDVEYSPDQRDEVMNLIESLDTFIAENEEESEKEEDDN